VNARVDRLRTSLEEPLLVTSAVNIRYLTGFRSSNAALLVEPDAVRLFTDFRYAERARALPGVVVVETPRNLLVGLAGHLAGRVAFEPDAVTYAGYHALAAGGAELVPRRGLVERLRAVKDEEELGAMRAAAAIADRAFGRLAQERFVGRTERELVRRMEELLRDEGGDEAAFPPVVAGAANGAAPHADPGDRVIEDGETVVVDAGCRIGGYCSDCTRTFATGPLPGRLRDAYAACLEAQLAALDAVRAGAHGRDVDAVARERIDGGPFAGTFGHGLGHGVGLEVHEAPALRPESEDVLEPRNAVTVEPGIYLPGEGGIRIEDLVVVTEDGCEVLSSFPKDLLEVG
jgi:Xaa-Pro aminopeptidase